MKITINFSAPAGWMAPYVAAACMVMAFAAVIASIAFYISAHQIRDETQALEDQLERYSARKIPAPVATLPQEKLAALRTQVQNLNSLTGTAGQALPPVLFSLEKLLPDGAWITNLQYRAREGETKLIAEADRTDLLTEFMDRLEHSGRFSQVLLTRQSQRAEGAQHSVQFEIQLRDQS